MIDQLKTDLENAVRRGDELFDQLEKLKKDNESLIEFKLVQIEQLMEEISKKDEIIKELEESNELYANFDNWCVTKNIKNTQEVRTITMRDCEKHEDVGYYLVLGGKLAREKKKKVEELRNQ